MYSAAHKILGFADFICRICCIEPLNEGSGSRCRNGETWEKN